jgi:hypothetical protein
LRNPVQKNIFVECAYVEGGKIRFIDGMEDRVDDDAAPHCQLLPGLALRSARFVITTDALNSASSGEFWLAGVSEEYLRLMHHGSSQRGSAAG